MFQHPLGWAVCSNSVWDMLLGRLLNQLAASATVAVNDNGMILLSKKVPTVTHSPVDTWGCDLVDNPFCGVQTGWRWLCNSTAAIDAAECICIVTHQATTT